MGHGACATCCSGCHTRASTTTQRTGIAHQVVPATTPGPHAAAARERRVPATGIRCVRATGIVPVVAHAVPAAHAHAHAHAAAVVVLAAGALGAGAEGSAPAAAAGMVLPARDGWGRGGRGAPSPVVCVRGAVAVSVAVGCRSAGVAALPLPSLGASGPAAGRRFSNDLQWAAPGNRRKATSSSRQHMGVGRVAAAGAAAVASVVVLMMITTLYLPSTSPPLTSPASPA